MSVEFREAAERYCALVEDAASLGREDFVRFTTSALAELLAAGSRLPLLEPDSPDVSPAPSEAEWRNHLDALQRLLGDWNDYWTTTEAYNRTGKAVCLSAAEDLADVWRDLKPGLVALERGASANDVTWQWRWGYVWHWGGHATEALRALHTRLAEGSAAGHGHER